MQFTTRIKDGALFAPLDLETVDGRRAPVPDRSALVHLQLRRFAGCPVCNLHLQSFSARCAEIGSAGVREVVVFHSPADELRAHAGDLPFAIVADPDRALYRALDVESSRWAILHPRAWPAIVVGITQVLLGRWRSPRLFPHAGRWGLPADFLIAPDGRVLAAKYGAHADDQWSVDELLALVGREARAPFQAVAAPR